MSRGPKKWTEKLIQSRIRAGYGSGVGSQYKPWFGVADLSSSGFSSRAYSQKFGRTIHLVSDGEWKAFLLFEWARRVFRLYEQWPLDRKLTLDVAAAMGVRHPYYPGTKVPVVMTVDFLVERRGPNGPIQEVYDCKDKHGVETERSVAKLEITRRALAATGIRHHLVFKERLPTNKCRNIEAIRTGMLRTGEIEPYPGCHEEHAGLLLADIARAPGTTSLQGYCDAYDVASGLAPGTALRLAKLLMFRHLLVGDLDSPDLRLVPLSAFQVLHPPEHERRAENF